MAGLDIASLVQMTGPFAPVVFILIALAYWGLGSKPRPPKADHEARLDRIEERQAQYSRAVIEAGSFDELQTIFKALGVKP